MLETCSTVPNANYILMKVGRIVLIHGGPSDGKLATIVEIIDHKRVCRNYRNIGALIWKY
jgi:hypothetical protein